MSFTPTNDYITSTYNIELDDKPKEIRANKATPNKKPKYLDIFDMAMDDKRLNTAFDKLNLENKLDEILNRCETYEQAFNEFSKLYENAPLKELEEIMFKAIVNSQIVGYEYE